MNLTFNIEEYFSHLDQTDDLSDTDIEKVILNRHRASGYELHFLPSQHDLSSRSYRKVIGDEKSEQQYLRRRYFEKLTALAEGNASIAMIFWLRSIQRYDETHFYIEPLEVTSLNQLEELKPETLFALAALVLHDTAQAGELALVLNSSAQSCRMLMRRLKRKGIVVETTNGYALNHLMYRQVVNELKKRNILHF